MTIAQQNHQDLRADSGSPVSQCKPVVPARGRGRTTTPPAVVAGEEPVPPDEVEQRAEVERLLVRVASADC